MSRRRAALLLLLVLLLAGCRTVRSVVARYPRPDIARIYAAARQNPERNPVIVIPGFAGSELVRQADGKIVWGAFFTKDALSYGREEGFRAFGLDVAALPARPRPEDLRHIDDDAEATAPLAQVRAEALVTDVSFDVYATLLNLLAGAGYRLVPGSGAAAAGGEGAAPADPAAPLVFTFAYDWRQDGVDNAIALGRFIGHAREQVREARRRAGLPQQPVRFDVIAHSMGGLVARYYLRYGPRDVLGGAPPPITWAGSPDVERLIMVGTPNFGSMKVLRDLIQGRGHPVLPRIQAALAATLTSVYQMLPRPQHALLWLDEGGRPAAPPPLYDVATWMENGWGPFAEDQERFLAWLYPSLDAAARRRHVAGFMAAALERGRRFHAALDQHPSSRPPTTLVLFAGDADATLERAVVLRRAGRLELVFDGPEELGLMGPGDGTVSRASALADERLAGGPAGWLRSPIPWDWTFFVSDRHTSFLRNPTFQNNLLHLLIEQPPRHPATPSEP
ncbi:MAG: hypothetical protein D6696_08865 [Acidobacteria bacterium]|nr:MAG: hypothetical protein D6696_08865 [Acidobacteriota bacterium]